MKFYQLKEILDLAANGSDEAQSICCHLTAVLNNRLYADGVEHAIVSIEKFLADLEAK